MTYLGQLLVEDGRKEGREEGRKEGREEGREEGRNCLLKDLVNRKLKKGQSSMEIAEDLEQDEETINRIIATLS